MSHTYIKADQNTPSVDSDGVDVKARGTRDGIQYTASWKQALLLEGRVHHASFGAMGASDIVQLTTGLNLDQPDFCISVPAGTSLLPLRIVMAAQYDGDADADDAFLIIMADTDSAYAGDGTVTEPTIMNHITAGGITSVATVFEDASGDITATTGSDPVVTKLCLDVAQQQVGVAGGIGKLRIDYNPEVPFIIDGPCAIYGYGGGSTDVPKWTGFATWAEVPTTRYAVS